MAGKALVPVNAVVVAEVRPRGRPSLYSRELAERICSRIATGETLISICRDADMPSTETVRLWAINDHDGFFVRYARARTMGVECEVEEIKHIADGEHISEVRTIKRSKFGTEVTVTQRDNVTHRQLQIDARKWRASKINWREYGERLGQLPEEKEDNTIRVTGGLPDDPADLYPDPDPPAEPPADPPDA